VKNNDIVKNDLKYLWHPYTQMKDCEKMPPIPIREAKGMKLYDYDGNFYYDTISSWWCNVHGHNHPHINEAIIKQVNKLEHVLFAGFTHEPAVSLAEKLVKILPESIDKIFYSDNGSTSVEVALKMSFQYWQNIGKTNKKTFLAMDKAYHGDTIGAMSVSGVDLYNKKFRPFFYDTYKAPTPDCYRCPMGKNSEGCSIDCLQYVEDILKKNSDIIAGIILEPILMGAGGMIIYPKEYLKGVSELSKKYNVHLILDEVATGFGRTGKMFASEHAGISPDFMCLSKGITSGYLPLGVTATTDEIYRSFYDEYEKLKTFYHGHTFTANPISCAAAIASLEVFEKEKTLSKVKDINEKIKSFLYAIKEKYFICNTRSVGAVGAFDLIKNKDKKEEFSFEQRMGLKVYSEGLKNNLLLRPLGNVIYFFLPLSVSSEELEDIFRRTLNVFDNIF